PILILLTEPSSGRLAHWPASDAIGHRVQPHRGPAPSKSPMPLCPTSSARRKGVKRRQLDGSASPGAIIRDVSRVNGDGQRLLQSGPEKTLAPIADKPFRVIP